MKNLLLCSLLLLLTVALQAQSQPKVLILGIDGCRPDALQAAATPNLDQLLTEAIYSYDGITEAPTWSGVGWAGMLTGVWRAKHGVIDNSFSGSNFASYPHFLQRVEAFDPNLKTVSISHWAPVNTQIVGNIPIDIKLNPTSDSLVGAEAVTYLTTYDPDVMFLHFDDVDHAGHAYGFYPTQIEYTDAIHYVDRQIGYVLNALWTRPNFANEDWIILVSTDHGGANGHGGASIEERNIFYILSRAGQTPTEIKKTFTVQNSNCLPDTLGLNMQGNGDYASVPNHSALQFGDTTDFTVEFRVKTSGWTGDPSFIGNKNWNSGNNPGFVFAPIWGSTANWKVNIGDGSNRVDVNGGGISDNVWHHIAASFDRDGLLTIYQDGAQMGTNSLANIGNINNTLALGIGQDGTLSYGSGMDGFLGEVRVWNTVVDSTTIAAWQCQQLTATHPSYAHLVGYWPMNEGSGTSITDLGPNTLTATYAGNTSDWQPVNTLDTIVDWSQTPRIVDVAVTALTHLCIPIDPAWNLDGKAVGVAAPEPQITGVDQVCELDRDFYSVAAATGHTVSWSVANGLILQGQDSSTVEVQWGGVGPGQLILTECNTADTLDVTISICSGRPTSLDQQLLIYPNPTADLVTIELPHFAQKWTYQCTDWSGKTVLSNTASGPKTQFDTSALPAGIYVLSVQANGQQLHQKLILR